MLRHFILCYRVLERRDNVKESAKPAKGEKERERESGKALRQHNRWSQRQQLSKRCAQKKLSWLSRLRALPLSQSLSISLGSDSYGLCGKVPEKHRDNIYIHTYILTYITYTRRCRCCWCRRRRHRRHFNFAVFFFRTTLRLCIYFQLHFQLDGPRVSHR